MAEAAGACRSARGAAVVRGAGGASVGFLASLRTGFGFSGTGFALGPGRTWRAQVPAASVRLLPGGARLWGVSCGGVLRVALHRLRLGLPIGGEASASCISGPGAISIGVG